VFNAEDTILDALESVAMQNYPNIEHIIIDGGSTDRTVEIIENNTHTQKWISEPDKGVYDAMNKGLALASGDVIGILNSDDFYIHKNVITNVVNMLENNSTCDMVLADVDFVQKENIAKCVRVYSAHFFFPWLLRFGFMPPHPGSFIKKEAYTQVGQYKLGYKIGADFDMFVRMLLVHKLSYVKLNKIVVRMRIGGVSTSGFSSYKISTVEMLRSLKENQIYSNLMMVLMRLPAKYLQKILPLLLRK